MVVLANMVVFKIHFIFLLLIKVCIYLNKVDGSFLSSTNNKSSSVTRRLLSSCQDGYYTSPQDAAVCDICPADFYCSSGVKNACPIGTTSYAGSTDASQCKAITGMYKANILSSCGATSYDCIVNSDSCGGYPGNDCSWTLTNGFFWYNNNGPYDLLGRDVCKGLDIFPNSNANTARIQFDLE